MPHRPFDTKLGAATIKAQQDLSEILRIPTFGIKGEVSTVPRSGLLSKLAQTVGVGQYTAETPKTFTTKLQSYIDQVRATGGTIGNTVFSAPSQATPNPTTPNPSNTNPKGPADIPLTDQFLGSLEKVKSFVGPIGLLFGAGLLVIVLLTRNRGN
jgi:hypothetical protein